MPRLVTDYLSGHERLRDAFAFESSISGLKKAWHQRTTVSTDRSVLVETLKAQARESAYVSEQALTNIERLLGPETVTVTTGHQLCVYGGPMFFLYKIISVVKLCALLKAEGIEAVPVYWMASEDHDFEEINHLFINGRKITWQQEVRGPVGRLRLDTLATLQHEVRELFRDDARYTSVLQELGAIFAPHKTLAAAVRDLVFYVFAAQGVVVLDADDRRLKALFAPVMEKELQERFSGPAVATRSAQLTEMGYPAQVHGRDINLFWMEDGYRERIVPSGEGFATADNRHQWSREELATELDTNPESFSPNVILRPLYQETILPNIAYIGGPGELSYWLQLKPVFDAVAVQFPVVLLRDMFLLVDEPAEKKVNQLGIGYADLWRPVDEVFTALIRDRGEGHENLVAEKAGEIIQLMEQLIEGLAAVHPHLEASARAERQRIGKRLAALQKKVLRSDKRTHAIIGQRLQYLHDRLFPQNTPQERADNWLQHHFDPSQLVAALLEHATPLDNTIKVMKY